MSKDRGGPYEVGYGKPPKHTRFRKGQSGNPSGRPKGAQSFRADMDAEANIKVRIQEGGKVVELTKQRASIRAQYNRSIKTGDPKAFANIARFRVETERADEDAAPDRPLSASEDRLLEDWLERQRPPEDEDEGSEE